MTLYHFPKNFNPLQDNALFRDQPASLGGSTPADRCSQQEQTSRSRRHSSATSVLASRPLASSHCLH